ncbi:hypothetical protein F0562_004388 [Nyssa sinensis]|uniref:Uncharacterized protein n=1 Tax=Nyssa sinensis TaxID=561372 RepID=A0A5J5BYG4_9ASTE|nr:hypothetical protein F0562_004388 [Nyssa sinensis]
MHYRFKLNPLVGNHTSLNYIVANPSLIISQRDFYHYHWLLEKQELGELVKGGLTVVMSSNNHGASANVVDNFTYKDAGVDIDAGSELVRRIAKMAPRIGGFGGLFPLDYRSLHANSLHPLFKDQALLGKGSNSPSFRQLFISADP